MGERIAISSINTVAIIIRNYWGRKINGTAMQCGLESYLYQLRLRKATGQYHPKLLIFYQAIFLMFLFESYFLVIV